MTALLSIALLSSLVAATPPAPVPMPGEGIGERAVRNYTAVNSGAIRFGDLTAAEQAEVGEVALQLRNAPRASLNPDCTPEQERRQRSDLDRAAWRLKCGK